MSKCRIGRGPMGKRMTYTHHGYRYIAISASARQALEFTTSARVPTWPRLNEHANDRETMHLPICRLVSLGHAGTRERVSKIREMCVHAKTSACIIQIVYSDRVTNSARLFALVIWNRLHSTRHGYT